MAVVISSAQEPIDGRLEMLAGIPGESSAYRYSDKQRCVLVFFRDNDKRWRWDAWASNAAFLAVETDAGGREGRRVFLAGGSFLETPKGRVLDCEREVECWEWLRSGDGDQVFCSDPEAVEQAKFDHLEFSLGDDLS